MMDSEIATKWGVHGSEKDIRSSKYTHDSELSTICLFEMLALIKTK